MSRRKERESGEVESVKGRITYDRILDVVAAGVIDLEDGELRELGFERFRQTDGGWAGGSLGVVAGLDEGVRRGLGLVRGEDRQHCLMVIIHKNAFQADFYKGDNGEDWRGGEEEKEFLLHLGEVFLEAKSKASDYQQTIFDLLLRKGNKIAGYLRGVKDDKARDDFRKMIVAQKSFAIERTLVFMCRPEDDYWLGRSSLWYRIVEKADPDLLKEINAQVELIKATLKVADLTEEDLARGDFRNERKVAAALWRRALLMFWQQYLEPHVKGDERGFLYLSKIRRGEPSSKQGNIMTFIVKEARRKGVSLLKMMLFLGAHEGFHGAQWPEERWFFDNVLFAPSMRQSGIDVAFSLYERPKEWRRKVRRIWGIESVICYFAGLGMYTPIFEGIPSALSRDHSFEKDEETPDFYSFWHNPCGRRLNGRTVNLAESIYYGGARFFWALVLTRDKDLTLGQAQRQVVRAMLEAAAETGDFGREFPNDLDEANRRVTAFFERVVEKLGVGRSVKKSEGMVEEKGSKEGGVKDVVRLVLKCDSEAERQRELKKEKNILRMVYDEVIPYLGEVLEKRPSPLTDPEVLFGDKRRVGDYLDLLAGLR